MRGLLLAMLVAAMWSGGAPTVADEPQRPVTGVGVERPEGPEFVLNQGQWADSILARGSAGETTIWITASGIYYQQFRYAQDGDGPPERRVGEGSRSGKIETRLLKARFVGGTGKVWITGETMQGRRCNFFLGRDPRKWRTDVPSYAAVTLGGVYEGVDLRISGREDGGVEYGLGNWVGGGD